jgi:hypothetical protein
LETLFLSSPQITDEGLEHLTALTDLKFLILGRSQVTDKGVQKLERALPKCEILRLVLRKKPRRRMDTPIRDEVSG